MQMLHKCHFCCNSLVIDAIRLCFSACPAADHLLHFRTLDGESEDYKIIVKYVKQNRSRIKQARMSILMPIPWHGAHIKPETCLYVLQLLHIMQHNVSYLCNKSDYVPQKLGIIFDSQSKWEWQWNEITTTRDARRSSGFGESLISKEVKNGFCSSRPPCMWLPCIMVHIQQPSGHCCVTLDPFLDKGKKRLGFQRRRLLSSSCSRITIETLLTVPCPNNLNRSPLLFERPRRPHFEIETYVQLVHPLNPCHSSRSGNKASTMSKNNVQ